jgi:ribosomal protein L40E
LSVDQEPTCACRQCGAELTAAAKFCRACGSTVPSPSPGVTCTRCGHVNPADSRFCRGCGTALTSAGLAERTLAESTDATRQMPAVAPVTPSNKHDGVRKGPSTTFIAVIAVLVAVGGAGVALTLVAGGKSGHSVHHALAGAATSTVVTEGEPAIASSSTVERPPNPTPTLSAGGGWPVGFAGYTVALASDLTRSDAAGAAAKARLAGLGDIGVLWSSDYSSLRPGYWFAFCGVYSTASAAHVAVPQARHAGFADAYVRRVEK